MDRGVQQLNVSCSDLVQLLTITISLGFCFEDPLKSLPLRVIFMCIGTGFLFKMIAKVSADSQGLQIFFLVPMTSPAVSRMVELRVPAVVDVLRKVA